MIDEDLLLWMLMVNIKCFRSADNDKLWDWKFDEEFSECCNMKCVRMLNSNKTAEQKN